jgi:hypothetical protein
MGVDTKRHNHIMKRALAVLSIALPLAGCATSAMETHQKGLETITEKEYFIPKKPVDRHYIGCAWSKQFGPVEDPGASNIRVKVEKSFDGMQQAFAYNVGISLGAKSNASFQLPSGSDQGVGTLDSSGSTLGLGSGGSGTSYGGTGGIEGGRARKSELEDVQIITPVSIADIPFEPNLPYITEALRLGNFSLKSEAGVRAGVAVAVTSNPAATGALGGQTTSQAGTKGSGLVVAYKLHMIDPKTYTKQESGSVALQLNRTVELSGANMFATARLQVIDVGANKPLPRNLLWACDEADAKSRDIVATWIIDLRSKDPKRRSLQIAFPAFPRMDACQSFSSVIFSKIDPLTDKIIRQKINITLIQEEVSDALQPLRWEARMSVVDESFNIKLVKQDDLMK